MCTYRFHSLLILPLLASLVSGCGSPKAPGHTTAQIPPTVVEATQWAALHLGQSAPLHLDSLLQFRGYDAICDSPLHLYHFSFPEYKMIIRTTSNDISIEIDPADSLGYRKNNLPVSWKELTTAFQAIPTPPPLSIVKYNPMPKTYRGTLAYRTPGTTDTLKIHVRLRNEPTEFPNAVHDLQLHSYNMYHDTLALKQ